MKLIVLAALVAAASARPQFVDNFNNNNFNNQNSFSSQDFGNQQFVSSSNGQPEVRILSQRLDQDDTGNYQYGYELDNGVKAEEVGRVQRGPEPETGSISMQGSYEFVGDDGNTYSVTYVADEGGFQPQGAHLPQAPAQIPEYAQLRRDHPDLFWAESQQLDSNQQFDNQQFSNNNQQFDNQQFSNNNQQFDNQQFSNNNQQFQSFLN